ncbi:LuxR C-terminal-related transcriptional regulator [Enemella sp. A6]|uniref:LuxR C-terminal-related transcriptional regulator n=1 Tax=Enemella sp. A6 TaxID=3440152 RepID=UPI003EBC4F98
MTIDEIEETYFELADVVVPADAAGFYLFVDTDDRQRRIRATLDADFLDDYEKRGRPDDPVLDFVVEHGLPIDSSRLRPTTWQPSGARQVLGDVGLDQSMEGPLVMAGRVVGTINFARAGTDEFEKADLGSTRFMAEHLSLALERAQRHAVVTERADLLSVVLDHMNSGVVVASCCGTKFIHINDLARATLDKETSTGTVEAEVREVLRTFVSEGRRSLTVTLRDVKATRIIVKIYRLPGTDAVMVELHDATAESFVELPAWDILSAREQEIAELVSLGLSTKEIAERAFVTQNTVKQHLKRIFAKTDVRNRAELIQAIWAARSRAEAE